MENLKKAIKLCNEEWLNTLPKLNEIPEYEFSKSQVERINEIIQKANS